MTSAGGSHLFSYQTNPTYQLDHQVSTLVTASASPAGGFQGIGHRDIPDPEIGLRQYQREKTHKIPHLGLSNNGVPPNLVVSSAGSLLIMLFIGWLVGITYGQTHVCQLNGAARAAVPRPLP